MSDLTGMFGQSGFDASSVDPSSPFDPIPAGKYRVQIIQSEVTETKNGAGQLLQLELEILEGEYKGRKLWDRINIKHSTSPKAQEIGQQQLSALCHATGKLRPRDSEEMHFIPIQARVTVTPAGPDKNGIHREAKNEIKGYATAEGKKPTASGATKKDDPVKTAEAETPAATKTTSAGAAGRPWMKKK